jgi:ABC-type bacteriocin/lantibiotic exporter with double-glycine peptidase domain
MKNPLLEMASPAKIWSVVRGVHLGYLSRLFAFTFKLHPALYWCAALYMASSAMEAFAMSAFIPLSEIAAGRNPSQDYVIIKLLQALDLRTSSKYIFLFYIVLFSLRVLTQILAERLLMNITYYRIPAKFMMQGLTNILQHYNIADIERQSTGQLTMLAGEEVHKAANIIATTIRLSSTFVLIVMYYITIAIFSTSTALGIMLFLGVTSMTTYGVFRKIHRLGVQIAESSRTAGSIFIDAINGVRSVRAFGAQNYVLQKFQEQIFLHKRRLFLVEFFNFFGKMFPMLLLVMSFGLYILIGTYISRAAFDYAFAVTLLILLLRFFLAVGDMVNVGLKVFSDAKSAQDITEIVTSPVGRTDAHAAAMLDAPVECINISDVTFSYTKQENVLAGFNARFERGTSYAIVGESGAGKSTLLDLLLGFHKPDAGAIIINDIPLDSLDEQSVRKRVVMLGQETIIFNDTVRNNITYGMEASDDEVFGAARLACVDDVISSLADGYTTELQYRGTNLSGGQRQRIGIARALLRKPDVLVLDESMSALDPITKETVIANILAAYRDKIVIFVSHDPSIRAKVDVVIEMKKLVKPDGTTPSKGNGQANAEFDRYDSHTEPYQYSKPESIEL